MPEKLQHRAIAIKHSLKYYFGKHCPFHRHAIYCVRSVRTRRCVVSNRMCAYKWNADNYERRMHRLHERRAKQRWLRERYREGWRNSRETMNSAHWIFQRKVQKFRENLKNQG